MSQFDEKSGSGQRIHTTFTKETSDPKLVVDIKMLIGNSNNKSSSTTKKGDEK